MAQWMAALVAARPSHSCRSRTAVRASSTSWRRPGPTARRCWPPRPTRSAVRCPERCCSRTTTGAARHTSNRPRPPACTSSPPTSATRPSPARGASACCSTPLCARGPSASSSASVAVAPTTPGPDTPAPAAPRPARGSCAGGPARRGLKGSTTCASVANVEPAGGHRRRLPAARAPGRLRGLRPAEGRLARTRPGPRGGAGRFTEVVQRYHPGRDLLTGAARRLDRQPGAGAAGGLGHGLMLLGGRRVSGVEEVLRAVGFAVVSAADLVVTGEGCFDWQSLRARSWLVWLRQPSRRPRPRSSSPGRRWWAGGRP